MENCINNIELQHMQAGSWLRVYQKENDVVQVGRVLTIKHGIAHDHQTDQSSDWSDGRFFKLRVS